MSPILVIVATTLLLLLGDKPTVVPLEKPFLALLNQRVVIAGTGLTLTVTDFESSGCSDVCVWSGLVAHYRLTFKGITYYDIQHIYEGDPKKLATIPYEIELYESDWKTYAEFEVRPFNKTCNDMDVWCLYSLAISNGDFDLCTRITKSSLQKQCQDYVDQEWARISRFSRQSAFCEKIHDIPLREKCVNSIELFGQP